MIVGRRRGLPGHRAVLGGLLVASAAVIVFAAALSASSGHGASYEVATRALPAGSVIGPGDTTTAQVGLSGANAAAAYRQPTTLIGRAVAVDVQPGELIQSSMLTNAGAGSLRPVSVPVDSDSLAALAQGEEVDVMSTPSGTSAGAEPQPPISVVLRGATLLSVGHSDSGLLSGGSGGTVVVTLGVSDLDEAEQLIQAAHSGTAELVRAEPSDGSGLGPGPAAGGSGPTTAGATAAGSGSTAAGSTAAGSTTVPPSGS